MQIKLFIYGRFDFWDMYFRFFFLIKDWKVWSPISQKFSRDISDPFDFLKAESLKKEKKWWNYALL